MTTARRLQLILGLVSACAACDEQPETPAPPDDTVPPVITALDPPHLATDVALDAVVTLTFSEPVNPATVAQASFLIRKGFDQVPGRYVVEGLTATFVPDVALDPFEVYSATATRAIRDPTGNPLPRDTAWSFQTAPLVRPAMPRRE